MRCASLLRAICIKSAIWCLRVCESFRDLALALGLSKILSPMLGDVENAKTETDFDDEAAEAFEREDGRPI